MDKKDILYFANTDTYDQWMKQVEGEKKNLLNQKRKKMAARRLFRAEGGCIVYLDDLKGQMTIIHSSGDIQKEEHVQAFSASERNYAVLYTDGSVKVFGEDNGYGQKNTENWSDITQILEAPNCTYGITKNGEIIYAGLAQKDVSGWKNIKMLQAGKNRIVGLEKDGKIKISDNGNGDIALTGQPDNWPEIKEIALSGNCIAGLTKDGRVLFCGKQDDARRQAEEWIDVITLTADSSFVYGLTSDGQIKVAGTCAAYFDRGRSDVSQWSKQERVLALTGNPSGGVAAVTESGELKMAGAISGDSDTICESWNHSIRPFLSEHAEKEVNNV